jgi:hypothetical protein
MAAQDQLTQYARMYGPIPGQTYSGLTPIAPTFPRPQTKSVQPNMPEKELYQRRRCLGFTTRELEQLDVLSNRKLNDGNLRNEILPLMAWDRWETKPPSPYWKRNYLYPVQNGTGYWTVDNPEVWRVLEPCVRLATRHLMSMHCLAWVRIRH